MPKHILGPNTSAGARSRNQHQACMQPTTDSQQSQQPQRPARHGTTAVPCEVPVQTLCWPGKGQQATTFARRRCVVKTLIVMNNIKTMRGNTAHDLRMHYSFSISVQIALHRPWALCWHRCDCILQLMVAATSVACCRSVRTWHL